MRAAGNGPANTDVIVIDPSPLTLARVSDARDYAKDDLIAVYTDDSDQAPEWQFASEGGEVTVTLPPQGIGEEMIKGRLYLRRNNSPSVEVPLKPFDFRLSPPAVLRLDRSEIDTARSIAPWSLRRLMAQRVGSVGVQLLRAEFELLYGLTTTVEPDASRRLRIAELDAFVGRVPFADALLDVHRRARSKAISGVKEENLREALEEAHAEHIRTWLLDLLYRPSWWPVFQDVANRQPLKIETDVQFNLRAGRQTADPFDIGTFAIANRYPRETKEHRDANEVAYKKLNEVDKNRPPLRGGVDWPFQSRQVYSELRRAPISVAGSIDGLAFGPLGGDGRQTAVFSNGKTLIISSTTQGRLNALTVIRVGRIAMLWNHARHVIVYERTARKAPRYLDPEGIKKEDLLDRQTPAFEGFMALRKVREYVEITQRRRDYPDIPTDRPVTGPLARSTFESEIIPIKGSWGRDISDGWLMPLRGPIDPGEELFYPEPAIFLELMRSAAKGEGRVAQRVRSPAQLLFFTSTRAEDGGDTDQWPAWPDVDFPLIDLPTAPDLPYRPSFAGSKRQPNAGRADFGHGRFTVDLEPAEEAVNLMSGRFGAGLDAGIYSLSLARRKPVRIIPESDRRAEDALQGSGN